MQGMFSVSTGRGESQGAFYQFNGNFPEYKEIIAQGASIFLLVQELKANKEMVFTQLLK